MPRTATTTKRAVLFNLHAAALWRRFITYLPRHLARAAGVTGKTLRASCPSGFVKVAEYQARGVVHFHAVIRLDANVKDAYLPPPARYDRRAADATRSTLAARSVRLDVPGPGPPVRLRFGRELDARPIWREDFAASGRKLDVAGGRQLHRQVRHQGRRRPRPADARIRHPSEIVSLRCPAHHKRMVETAWDLGARTSVGDPRLRRGRTCSATAATSSPSPAATPSPSATSAANAPNTAKPERRPDGELDPWGRPLDERVVLVLADCSYAGTGYTPRTPGAELALLSADMARGD